jgi:ABC-2 type transport system ATP-binding protein
MPSNTPAVILERLSRTFVGRKGGIVVFQDVELTIPVGARVNVMGPNGVGKTTLLRMVAGIVLPSAGSVRVAANDGGLIDPSLVPGAVSGVFDGYRGLYWKLTVDENIAYFGGINGLRRRDALFRTAELLEKFDLSTKRGEFVETLSKGSQQKLALACALGLSRPILLLDEPTAMLDEKSCATLDGLLQERSRDGLTTVVATHNRHFAALNADYLIQMTSQSVRMTQGEK